MPVVDDGSAETGERFRLKAAGTTENGNGNLAGFTAKSDWVTINDRTPPPTEKKLAVRPAGITVGEGSDVSFTVETSGQGQATQYVLLSTSVEDGDTAETGDFDDIAQPKKAFDGSTGKTRTFTVRTSADADRDDETFTITAAPDGGPLANVPAAQVKVTIQDTTKPPTEKGLTVDPASITVDEGATVRFTVTVSGTERTQYVRLSTAPGGAERRSPAGQAAGRSRWV